MTVDVYEKISILGSRYRLLMDKIFSDLDYNEKKVIIESVDSNNLDYLLYLTSYDIKDLNNIVLFLEAVMDNSNTKSSKEYRSKFLFNSILVVLKYIDLDYLKELKLSGNTDIYKLYIKDSYFFYEKGYYSNFKDVIYKDLGILVKNKLIDKGVNGNGVHDSIINYFNKKNYFSKLFPLKLFVKDDKFDNGVGMKILNKRLDEIITHYLTNDFSDDLEKVTLEDVSSEFRSLESNELKEIFKNIKLTLRKNKKEKLDLEKLYKYEEKLIKNIYNIVYEVLLSIDKDSLLKGEELRSTLKVPDAVFNNYLNSNKRYFSYLEKEYIAKQISLHLLEHLENYPINIEEEIKNSESILRRYVKYIALTELYESSSSYYKIKEVDLLNYEKLFMNVPQNLVVYYEDLNFKYLSNKKFIDFKTRSYFEIFKFVFYGLNYLNENYLKFVKSLDNNTNLMKDYLDGIINLTYNKGKFTAVLDGIDKSNYLKGKGSLDDKLELYVFLKNNVPTDYIFDWFKEKNQFLEDNSVSQDIVKMYKNESANLLSSIPEEKDVMRMERFILLLRKYNLDSEYDLNLENNTFLDFIKSLNNKLLFDKSNRFFTFKVSDNVNIIFSYRYVILKTTVDGVNNLKVLYKTPSDISTYKGSLLGTSYVKDCVYDLIKDKKYNIDNLGFVHRQIDCIYKVIEESWDLRKSPVDESSLKSLEARNLSKK